jgi:hypothetical protein
LLRVQCAEGIAPCGGQQRVSVASDPDVGVEQSRPLSSFPTADQSCRSCPPSIDQDTTVTIQLKNDDGTCWEADFTAPAITNEQVEFRDKSD